ncbi:type II secretion system minor pseudopilin GspK [uncultured Roseobacter sp.]|uniref:type II secretion system minor pseudopilin GspK n=1 Tax=uncultured Roseobacter sp. TaxID=114847 RepID=UPI002623716E|nr:type II secretion system minor pseudopilin GspK [uncultured Roseobacter sp.]
MTRRQDQGVALVNVLLVMAISAALVQTMLLSQEKAISETQKASDRAQAFALAKGGVASLRTALARDLRAAPESDHLQEAWARVAQEQVTYDFGGYSVSIDDAQARFNLNSLSRSAIAQQRVFSALLTALELPAELAPQITDVIAREGPLVSVAKLRAHGISDRFVEDLSPYVAALPAGQLINLNTASEPVLEAVFANPIVARNLSARRTAQGYLTGKDLSDLGVVQPALAGWRSDSYDIEVRAAVGTVDLSYKRRVIRDPESELVIDMPRH